MSSFKIHVNSSTGVSLNERFTAMSSKPTVTVGRRSRSRSVERPRQRMENVPSRANQRFLAELQRKHKLQAALKLKRRSLRTFGGVGAPAASTIGRIKRGSVTAFRVGANGRPIRTNSLANIATMNADREMFNKRPTLRRSNSSSSVANRLGPRRPIAGGAAQRVVKRRLELQREARGRTMAVVRRGRSRTRSLTRLQEDTRSRSRSRNPVNAPLARGRSRSRSRTAVRSRSRSRGLKNGVGRVALPIKARLGRRPVVNGDRSQIQGNRRVNNRGARNASLSRRGVQTGRVQKKPVMNATASANGRQSRPRSRSAARTAPKSPGAQRSRSRTRQGQVGQQARKGQVQPQRRRGRSQQRQKGGNNSFKKGSNQSKANDMQKQRRGRSRSRTGGRGGPRTQGAKQAKPGVNKDELDKELDQYMATTKTEHDMDFLLKN